MVCASGCASQKWRLQEMNNPVLVKFKNGCLVLAPAIPRQMIANGRGAFFNTLVHRCNVRVVNSY